MKILSFPALFTAAAIAMTVGPAVPAGASEGAAEHKVQKSDNLHLMAAYYYRDPRLWRKIYRANREVITDPNHLVPGTVLSIEGAGEPALDISYGEFKERVYR